MCFFNFVIDSFYHDNDFEQNDVIIIVIVILSCILNFQIRQSKIHFIDENEKFEMFENAFLFRKIDDKKLFSSRFSLIIKSTYFF